MSAYEWKTGSRITVSAQTAGEMCEKLAAQGRLTAQNLVDENRPEDAPLHAAFEWRDDAAAEEWRKHQARHIIGSLCFKTETKEAVPMRVFFNIERKEPQYKHLSVIMENPDDMEQLFKTAMAELSAFQRKYASVKKLEGVFAAIDQVRIEVPA